MLPRKRGLPRQKRGGVELPKVGLGETPAEVGAGLFSESQYAPVPSGFPHMTHLELPLRDHRATFCREGDAPEQRAGAKAG